MEQPVGRHDLRAAVETGFSAAVVAGLTACFFDQQQTRQAVP